MRAMKKPRTLDAATLWQIARVGGPALSPDGRQLVCSVTTTDTAKNQNSTHLWLLHTASEKPPRQLTGCGGKDGQAAWSPRGDAIAFISRRGQEGEKDSTAQLYLIAPDGGEAQRVSHFGPGIESFKWMPDGQRIVCAAWVWPGLKTAAAQNKQHKAWTARKETGYATSEAYYRYWDHNVPQGRVLHLLMVDVQGRHAGRVVDLFAGTGLELPRHDEGNAAYDVHPSGQHIAFVHDPAAVQRLGNPLALAELHLKTRRVTPVIQDLAWDCAAPRYSPDGHRIAAVTANVGRVHTALGKLALVDRQGGRPGRWQTWGDTWDHDVEGPLRWAADGQALYFKAEERGRCHLWRHDLNKSQFDTVYTGGWVQAFDATARTLAVAADSAQFPTRLYALDAGDSHGNGDGAVKATVAQRLDPFNDTLINGLTLGQVHEVKVLGARDKKSGSAVQMWLTFPPGFDPAAKTKQKLPVTHVIHGGPYAAAGDTFGFRWNTQVLAAHGHVIAQVNFHGSSGFGHAFRHSLIGRQGALELQDIEAGTDWLLQQPWADASRVFATGGSYGGFLVAWMNGHVPNSPARPQSLQGRYRAYVCHAGVFDRVATFSADSYPVRPKDLAANFWQDMPRVLAQSPHAFAGRMNTPTLVIHGAQDFRVPDCNGLAYYNTLKARGVEARLLWFPDENHWVLKPQNSLQWYAEFLAWLDRFGVPETAPSKRRKKPDAAPARPKKTSTNLP